jgi:hypothetical protein
MWQEIPCIRHCGAKIIIFEDGLHWYYKAGDKEHYLVRWPTKVQERPWHCDDCTRPDWYVPGMYFGPKDRKPKKTPFLGDV